MSERGRTDYRLPVDAARPAEGSTTVARLAQVAEAESSAEPSARMRSATILLVEDEPSLRALAREVLREAGYHVLEAANGKKALEMTDTLTRQPDLLLTDMVMPAMGGLELAEKLRKRWPGLAVLYTSGYSNHAAPEHAILPGDMPFLQKPYMPEALLEQVGAALEGKRRGGSNLTLSLG